MTVFSILCYVLFGYLAVAGVLLFTKGFHKDVGVEKKVKYTDASMREFEKPGAVCLTLAGVAGVWFTGFSDSGMGIPCAVSGILLVIFLAGFYILRMVKLKKK